MTVSASTLADWEVAKRAAAMLRDLEGELRVQLATATEPERRDYLQKLANHVPTAALLLGMAVAARESDSAIRRGQ